MICASLVEPGLGIAVKVRDGGHRAAGPALIHVLGELGALAGDQRDRLARYATPPVMGGGEPVGEVRADFALERA
jgi:L-asparaginase II